MCVEEQRASGLRRDRAKTTRKKKDDKNKPRASALRYEDISVDAVAGGGGADGRTGGRISRSFTVGSAGDYDVYVVVKEPTPDKKNAPAPKMSLLKQTVTVPGFLERGVEHESL